MSIGGSVTNQLPASNDLAHGEKSEQLSSEDASGDNLCLVEISDALPKGGWVCVRGVRYESRWVTDGFDDSLEVGLESCDVSG